MIEDKTQLNLKLVAQTRIWSNLGDTDMPLWRPSGGKEYLICRFKKEPTFYEIAEAIELNKHKIETREQFVQEVYVGYDLFMDESMTHNEAFQYYLNKGSIDFETKDLTEISGEEELGEILGSQ